jgi:hypothetical protein
VSDAPPSGEGRGAAAEEPRGAAAPAGATPEPPPRERYGPLELERTRKDDGRALLYFLEAGAEPGA